MDVAQAHEQESTADLTRLLRVAQQTAAVLAPSAAAAMLAV